MSSGRRRADLEQAARAMFADDFGGRNAALLWSVLEGNDEAGLVFCDLPTVPAGWWASSWLR